MHTAAMSTDLESIHNHHEPAVFDAIRVAAGDYPLVVGNGLLPDVACVALNRLAPRYIRHRADLSFYLSARAPWSTRCVSRSSSCRHAGR